MPRRFLGEPRLRRSRRRGSHPCRPSARWRPSGRGRCAAARGRGCRRATRQIFPAVVEDRRGNGRDAHHDVLVTECDARLEYLLEPLPHGGLVGGRAFRPLIDRHLGEVLVPERARLVGQQRARGGADMERKRAAERDREHVRALAGQPLDEHRLPAAAHAQVHRLLGLGAQALERRHRDHGARRSARAASRPTARARRPGGRRPGGGRLRRGRAPAACAACGRPSCGARRRSPQARRRSPRPARSGRRSTAKVFTTERSGRVEGSAASASAHAERPGASSSTLSTAATTSSTWGRTARSSWAAYGIGVSFAVTRTGAARSES